MRANKNTCRLAGALAGLVPVPPETHVQAGLLDPIAHGIVLQFLQDARLIGVI